MQEAGILDVAFSSRIINELIFFRKTYSNESVCVERKACIVPRFYLVPCVKHLDNFKYSIFYVNLNSHGY